MSGISHNTALLTRYLLGDLPVEDQNRLEEKYFSDDDFLHSLLDVKDQLFSNYASGAMPVVDRARFEQRFLATAQGQKEVELISMLQRREQDSITPVGRSIESRPRVSGASRSSIRRPSRLAVGAFAAAAMVLILGVWFATRSKPNQTAPALTAAERSSDLATVLSLDLSPGQRRSDDGKVPPVAAIDASHGSVLLKLKTGQLEYASYQADVQRLDDGDHSILTADGLKAQETSSGFIVPLEIPAAKLPEGDYKIKVKGVLSNGTADELRSYFFSVIKK